MGRKMGNLKIFAAWLLLMSTARADISSNLIHRFTCDAGSGTSLADTGSANKTGTFAGSATWVTPGKLGAANLSFPGFVTGSYGGVSGAAPSGIQAKTTVTVSFWVKVTHIGDYNVGVWASALWEGDYNYRFEICGGQTSNPRDVHLAICNGAASYVYVANALPSTNVWHHVCVTYDGGQATDAAKVKLYVNGSAVTVGSWNAAVPSSLPNNTLYGWQFGRRIDATGPSKHDMDEIRVYDRALSASDVSQLYSYTMATRSYRPSIRNNPSKVLEY